MEPETRTDPQPATPNAPATADPSVAAREIADLQDALEAQRAELSALRAALLRTEAIEAEKHELQREADDLRRRLEEVGAQLADRQALVDRLEGVLEGMKRSVSWRATVPLREGRGLLRGRRG